MPITKKSWIFRLTILTAVIAVLVFFFGFSKKIAPPEAISIGNIGEYSVFNIIAQKKNLFTENGLNASVTEFGTAPETFAALISGKVDIAVSSDIYAVQVLGKNPQIRIISQYGKGRVVSILGRRDRGISKISDLKGKTVGLVKVSIGEFIFGQFLKFNGLSAKDVKIVYLNYSQINSQLKEGKIDAAVTLDQYVFSLTSKMGKNLIVWPASESQEVFGVLLTTENFIKNRPQAVKKYLKSLISAEDYLNKKPDEAKSILSNAIGVPKEYLDYSLSKNTYSIRLDQELILAMENLGRWMIRENTLKEKVLPNFLNYIYFDGLESLKPDVVTIVH